MAKIISVTQSCVPGGVYRTALIHTAFLRKKKHNSLYYSIIGQPNKYWSLFDEYGIRPLYTSCFRSESCTRIMGDIVFSKHFVEDVKSSDLIIAHNNPGARVALEFKKKYNIPFVFYLHDSLVYPIFGSIYNILFNFKKLARRYEDKFLQYSDLVIVNSQITLKKIFHNHYLTTNTINDKIKILYPTLNIPLEKKEIVQDKQEYLLIVGRIDHEAFYYLYNIIKRLNFPLIIAGYGHPHNNNFKKILRLYKNLTNHQKVKFIFSPSDDELLSLYKNACLFVYPGHENFNMSALEAMSAGCPILVADTSGILDIVSNDLRDKIALPKNDIHLWVERINRIIQSKEYIDLGNECWKATANYNLNTHLKCFEDLINKFI
ncbi:glycosyltransferase family 4 protein [Desulfohalobiaceae bacterium Ax17]|uniref:glycosyltransferase family 4 protein n=1 Tax=Desulfovulcanus ferrireducens TaxID=2831190 RepID=UPI00207BB1EC|nr:glycosyltransferase family 4 protein [Desulfovulcanus ferrireducens]MBT8764475.1 glycosyltransferase family 4 protein [Desulfovulcanus ferrireducens]